MFKVLLFRFFLLLLLFGLLFRVFIIHVALFGSDYLRATFDLLLPLLAENYLACWLLSLLLEFRCRRP
jgi:hypothetical protein